MGNNEGLRSLLEAVSFNKEIMFVSTNQERTLPDAINLLQSTEELGGWVPLVLGLVAVDGSLPARPAHCLCSHLPADVRRRLGGCALKQIASAFCAGFG